MSVLRFLGNVVWLLFAGLWLALGYALAGLVMFLLIVTIPWGVAAFRNARFALWPFGRTVVSDPSSGVPSTLGNIIWLVLAGVWLAIGHVVTAIPLFLSIVGIPFGWANLKLVPLALWPLGQRIVTLDEARALATVPPGAVTMPA